MDYIFIIGLLLLILGALALVGFKILPIKKSYNWIMIVVGILLVTGLGMSLWSGLTSLAVTNGGNPAPSPAGGGAYAYSVLATRYESTDLLDENARVINIPETYNSTAGTVNYATVSANFTIGITDAYADMRGVEVQCSTPAFYQQNVSVSDSTQYLIVSKDTAGLADIRIYDSAGAYQRRSRTFLLGGQASSGQSIIVRVHATADATAVSKLNTYNSQDISCNLAGQQWTLRVQKVATVT